MINNATALTLLNTFNKFSIAQATSNNDGKTSGLGVGGLATTFVALIGFIFGLYDKIWGTKTETILMYSSGLVATGLGALSYRKSKETQVDLSKQNNSNANASTNINTDTNES